MDDAPPPTDHVLRPHHITLLSVLMMAFKDLEIKRFPSQFALHIHQTLLTEIAEVCPIVTAQYSVFTKTGRPTKIIPGTYF